MLFSWQSHHNSHTTLQLSWTLEMGQPCRFNVQARFSVTKAFGNLKAIESHHWGCLIISWTLGWFYQMTSSSNYSEVSQSEHRNVLQHRTSSFCSHHERSGFSGSVWFASVRSCSVYQRTVETCQVHSHATFQPNWYVCIYIYTHQNHLNATCLTIQALSNTGSELQNIYRSSSIMIFHSHFSPYLFSSLFFLRPLEWIEPLWTTVRCINALPEVKKVVAGGIVRCSNFFARDDDRLILEMICTEYIYIYILYVIVYRYM